MYIETHSDTSVNSLLQELYYSYDKRENTHLTGGLNMSKELNEAIETMVAARENAKKESADFYIKMMMQNIANTSLNAVSSKINNDLENLLKSI